MTTTDGGSHELTSDRRMAESIPEADLSCVTQTFTETASRSVPEWIGATPDTPVPPRVRARVFQKYQGRCHRSGVLIRAGDAWDADHIKALINGGENRESNLAPILRGKAHKEKTAEDLKIKSKTARMRLKHLGLHKSKGPKIKSRGFGKRT
jgi:5-methylcytosine-specific restriction protein A